MSYPFRCTKCEAMKYTQSVTDVPVCHDLPMQELVSICWLIPCPPEKTPVHTSGLFEKALNGTEKWIFACGRTNKPPIYSPDPDAVTCEKCRAEADKLFNSAGWNFPPPENVEHDIDPPIGEPLEINITIEDEVSPT